MYVILTYLCNEEQKVTIRSNLDKKILNLYSEGKCLSDIQATLTKVGQDFKKNHS